MNELCVFSLLVCLFACLCVSVVVACVGLWLCVFDCL